MKIVAASSANLSSTLDLLEGADLPVDGVSEHFADFLVASDEDGLIGAIGLEFYGRACLLRSLVVAPEKRRAGTGRALMGAALAKAESRDACCAFLLTEGAEGYFLRRGFRTVSRAEAEPLVGESVEFKYACCDSAVCMRIDLPR